MTRSDAYLLDLLERAGYTLRGSALQRNFPKGLFKVCSCFPCWRPSELALPERMSISGGFALRFQKKLGTSGLLKGAGNMKCISGKPLMLCTCAQSICLQTWPYASSHGCCCRVDWICTILKFAVCSGAHVCGAAKGADFLRRYSLLQLSNSLSKRLIGEGRSDSVRDDGENTQLYNPRTIAGRETVTRLKGGCANWKVLRSLEELGVQQL